MRIILKICGGGGRRASLYSKIFFILFISLFVIVGCGGETESVAEVPDASLDTDVNPPENVDNQNDASEPEDGEGNSSDEGNNRPPDENEGETPDDGNHNPPDDLLPEEGDINVSKESLQPLSFSGVHTDSFSVSLTHQPVADVIVALSVANTAAGTLSTSTLTFTRDNWNAAQEVIFNGLIGAQELTTTIDLRVTSNTPGYLEKKAAIEVTICGISQFVGEPVPGIIGVCYSLADDQIDLPHFSLAVAVIPDGAFVSTSGVSSINAFFMSKEETDVASFRVCVEAGACSSDHYKTYDPTAGRDEVFCNYGRYDEDSQQKSWLNHPMNCVDHRGAQEYCAWLGGRLPTADEWRYAATHDGTQSLGTTYAWGNEVPSHCLHANYAFPENVENQYCYSTYETRYAYGTSHHDAYSPEGDSPLGLKNMIGNVWEWTDSSSSMEGTYYFVMGGAWIDQISSVMDSAHEYESSKIPQQGFRCVIDVPEYVDL